jgi:peptide/nickel transport system ATP-binding protein
MMQTEIASPVLAIDDLTLALPRLSDRRNAVQNLSLTVAPGETVCVVGESGSGKSLTAYAVMGLLPHGVRAVSGSIRLAGTELLGRDEASLCRMRGRDAGMVFQEPMTSLNPIMRVGEQIAETFKAHHAFDPAERMRRSMALLDEVHLPDPPRLARAYPHELSGGQRQRVMIAIALALEPKLLIADEPTTALDVTTQAQVLKLIGELRAKRGMAVLFITHDFGVVAEIADRVVVLQEGSVVEQGPVASVLKAPQHPYTRRLLAAVPSLEPPPSKDYSGASPSLQVQGLSKTFAGRSLVGRGREVRAVADVGFTIRRGETLGLVGESGSGKSTVGRCVLRLIEPDQGAVHVGEIAITDLPQAALRRQRRRIQMVFQDPYASLNPRRTVGRIIAEGPVAQGVDEKTALSNARRLLGLVGLPVQAVDRYPHEFSGGQRQRIGIARALALEPEVLVADEPVSALDVSVQAQILELIRELQDRLGVAILFITHDLRVAAQVCDRIAVMRKGRIVETQDTAGLFASPQHPYTQQLLAAVPGARRLR